MRILQLRKTVRRRRRTFRERVKDYVGAVAECEKFLDELGKAIKFYRGRREILPIKSQRRHVNESTVKVFAVIDGLYSRFPRIREKIGRVEVNDEDLSELMEIVERFGEGAEMDAANKWYLEKLMEVVDRYVEGSKHAESLGGLMKNIVAAAEEAVRIDEKHEKITDVLAFGGMEVGILVAEKVEELPE